MARNVREHRTAIHFLATKCFGEIYAVNDVVFRSLDVQHAKDRRIQIGRLNAQSLREAGFGDTWPGDDGRNTNAAFVDAALAAPGILVRVVFAHGEYVVCR